MEDMNMDVETVEEAVAVEMTGVALELNTIVNELAGITLKMAAAKEIVGKAAYKAEIVSIRKELLPYAEKVKQVWRNLYIEAQEVMAEIPSARKQKTAEQLREEAQALLDRAASM